MWLLDTSTLALCSFTEDNVPSYIILSHTWESEEVSFQDIQLLNNPAKILEANTIKGKAGYVKIRQCCARAASSGFKYAWIDTCCIDKTNSAELVEAINSMFKWYRKAAECYAYLQDVRPRDIRSTFRKSRWFTRGWTLQELIAPPTILFFDYRWSKFGTKASLSGDIEDWTTIPSAVLMTGTLTNYSVAKIMSWAAGRKTTRVEDMAYSLLGLFGVSMPMVYGEGEKAFTRLQLEIMKTSTDHSLFAWKGEGDVRGPLARSPAEFAECGNIGSGRLTFRTPDSAYEMTNVGLRITLRVSSNTAPERDSVEFAFLNCKEASGSSIGIWLKEVVLEGQPTGLYVRTLPETLYPDQKHLEGGSTLPFQLYLVQPEIHLFNGTEGFDSMDANEISQLYSDFGTLPERASTPEVNDSFAMEPMSEEPVGTSTTVLHALRSLREVSDFGSRLAQFLEGLMAALPLAHDVHGSVDSIRATTSAMENLLPFLEDESRNEASGGNNRIFSGKAISVVQKEADRGLSIFWRIEAAVLSKDRSKKLDFKIPRQLSRFHEEINENKESPILKLDIGPESEWTSLDRFKWGLLAGSKLDKYNTQLYRLQTTLVLMFQVISLNLTTGKQKFQPDELRKASEQITRSGAAQAGLSEELSSPGRIRSLDRQLSPSPDRE